MTIWLHIGTAKSGTTSLQRALLKETKALSAHGLRYVSPAGALSCNALAIAINKGRSEEKKHIVEDLNRQIADAGAQDCIISSEFFFGMSPAEMFETLPVLAQHPVRALVYLRRQDRYVESLYLQKLKTVRFSGSIDAFIRRFHGSGSDYSQRIAEWEQAGAKVDLRICEPDKLIGGSTVTDAFSLMGVQSEPSAEQGEVYANTTPSIERIQLLHALQRAGHPNVRKFQRALPPDPKPRARIMSVEDKRTFLEQYSACNETLRARYRPDSDTLFDMSDLMQPGDPVPTGFTPEQLADIEAMFNLMLRGR